jgi:hypothetical protein
LTKFGDFRRARDVRALADHRGRCRAAA